MSNPTQADSPPSDASKAKNKPSKFRRNILMIAVCHSTGPAAAQAESGSCGSPCRSASGLNRLKHGPRQGMAKWPTINS